MPEEFDLDDENYDPIGIVPPQAPPKEPATPVADSQTPPSSVAAHPSGSTGSGPPTTGNIRPPVPSRPVGSVPSRASHTIIGGGEPAGGPPTIAPRTAPTIPSQVGVPPHTRASDLLRGHPNYKAQESSDSRSKMSFLTSDRPNFRFDDTARWLLRISGMIAICTLIYYFYGVFSGNLAKEMYAPLSHADKARFISNLDVVHQVMTWSLLVAVPMMIFLFYDESSAAYALVGTALFLQVLFPLLVAQYFDLAKLAQSDASVHLCSNATQVAWIPGIPGICLIILDLARRFVTGIEEQKFKRKHLQYGQGVLKTDKTRNIFLGNCWSMPFCRENIRAKCPIFLKHMGPCWRTKRGCMCDETIVLNASAGNWKQSVASAAEKLDGHSSAKSKPATASVSANQSLSMAFKKERCRQCVIYSTHQEQKYKALVFLAFVGVGVAFYYYSGELLTLVAYGYHHIDTLCAQFSFNTLTGQQPSIPHHQSDSSSTDSNAAVIGAAADLSTPVGWVILIIVTMVVLSKVLQLIEYTCFNLKI